MSVDSQAAMLRVVVHLRDAYPDYGRPPRGQSAWQGLALLGAALLFVWALRLGLF